MLPQDFLDRMEQMLGEEYPAFLASYEKERFQSLRVNLLKNDRETFLKKSPFALEPIPWCTNGFYYSEQDRPGKHPYHEAGVYYIQEPSAMAPAEYLMDGVEVMEQERILDLCAAPGGKSTQIAAAMGGQGILVCNEIHPARAKILSENVERMGIRNAMVTNETPQRLSEVFTEYFTRILVDAPCSGEGMFRKNEDACGEWSLGNVQICADRQDEILDCAAGMLASGGRLVYSTCTFAPAENEGSISRFLQRHPEFIIERVKKVEGMEGGVAAWASWSEELCNTIRLWPHKLNGEGHYLAVLRKAGELRYDGAGYCRNGLETGISAKEQKMPGKGCVEFLEFAKEALKVSLEGTYLKFGDQLYMAPKGMPAVKGLKVLRPGLHLGTIKKNRFEPSHALALALHPEEVMHIAELKYEETDRLTGMKEDRGEDSADKSKLSKEIRGYLNGETFTYEGVKGWYLITVDGYSIGWGKLAGGVMKNHYPKGLRKLI
ncbi:MAG: RsmB/NOP family class I SAM-dependent RNA methyltransferase [Roseburia sp.]|nr:RsmB/NOP family class I SAM-dependent RNA methyltransferase [Roseburia sp.]